MIHSTQNGFGIFGQRRKQIGLGVDDSLSSFQPALLGFQIKVVALVKINSTAVGGAIRQMTFDPSLET